jgi:hypothetical protein
MFRAECLSHKNKQVTYAMLFAEGGSVASFFQQGLSCPSNHIRYTESEKYVNENFRNLWTVSMHGSYLA